MWISNHNAHLDELDAVYTQRIHTLLNQKREIAKQMNRDFMQRLKAINDIIYAPSNYAPTNDDNLSSPLPPSPPSINQKRINLSSSSDRNLSSPPSLESPPISMQPKKFVVIPYKSNKKNQSRSVGKAIPRKHRIKVDKDKKNQLNGVAFRCGTCSKCFTSKGALVVHERLHTGALPFECKVCHKRFNQIPQLRWHLLSHTNELPYKCQAKSCGEGFKSKVALETHIKNSTHELWNKTIIKTEPTHANRLLEESLIHSRGYGLNKKGMSKMPKLVKIEGKSQE